MKAFTAEERLRSRLDILSITSPEIVKGALADLDEIMAEKDKEETTDDSA